MSLWDDFQRSFYTEPIMVVLNVLFVVLAVKNKSKDKKIRVLKLYGIAALIQDILSFAGSLTDHISIKLYNDTFILNDISIMAFIQIEFYAFYRFFYFQFEGKPIQAVINKVTHILIAISITASLIAIFKSNSFIHFKSNVTIHNFTSYLSVISSILLLTPSFYYFYVLFTDPPIKNLLTEPSFWITTGIAFLHGLNIPLFLINGYLLNRHSAIWFDVYTINFVAYCFLFILFIIAILCKNTWNQKFSHQTAHLTG